MAKLLSGILSLAECFDTIKKSLYVSLNNMRNIANIYARPAILFSAALVVFAAAATAQNVIKLDVDATDAGKNIIHIRETMSVRPGPFALFYPKWIPGEHSPTGPINDMVNLVITANGKPIDWDRDDVEMFAFHLTIPAGVRQVVVAFDDVSQPRTVASAQLSRIKWNR